MHEFKHGGDIYSAKENCCRPFVDFSANINPLGIPSAVKAAMTASLEDCVHYPDPFCRELVGAIAAQEQVKPEWLFCGNGAADVIFALVYAQKPKRALVLAPTFSEYEQALRAVSCSVMYHQLYEENNFKLTESFIDTLDASIDMVFLCNPNNPTGQLIDQNLLLRILQRCDEVGIRLVLDECFIDFLDEPKNHTLLPLCSEYTNLFILKSFTKLFALAGVRLGYGICRDVELLEQMHDCVQPWGVSSIAQAAGIAALTQTAYIADTRAVIKEERRYLLASIKRLGLQAYGSHANYIFFKADACVCLQSEMEKRGFLIRSCANYHGLSNDYFRIAVKSHANNEALIGALESILSDTNRG
jgi:threonine-phosphate decarboxylase